MSTPVVFIILPGLSGVLLFVLQKHHRIIKSMGAGIMLLLLLIAWRLPVASPIFLGVPGLPPLVISDSISILGRRFFLDDSMRPVLILIYLIFNFWYFGSFAVRISSLFYPFGLGICALIAACLAVNPPLYAALFIVLLSLVSIPILSPPGKPASLSAMRLLVFQVMGMGLILFSDWYLSTFQTDPQHFRSLAVAASIFSLGLAFSAGIFPFHTWIPMASGTSNPFTASFMIFLIPFTASIAGLRYLAVYNTLGPFAYIQPMLRPIGLMMILLAGCWTAIEQHLGRMMAFAMMVQIGTWLLAFSISDQSLQGIPFTGIFFTLLIPQAIAFVVWGIAAGSITYPSNRDPAKSLKLQSVKGFIHQYPVAGLGLLAAIFSLSGLPLLASFPILVGLSVLVSKTSLINGILLWIGHTGLLIAGLRLLRALTQAEFTASWKISENKLQIIWLSLGILLIVFLGLFPQSFLLDLYQLASFTTGQLP